MLYLNGGQESICAREAQDVSGPRQEDFIADYRPRRMPEPRTRINERIRAREIRVIDDEGKQLGIMPPQEALAVARQRQLDLVEVSPTAQPQVCRIMDYGKYQYQMEKKAREARKHQKNIVIKEIKFFPNCDDHDYEFKKNNIVRFLGEGDKVKAMVRFRGREITHKEIGFALINRLLADVDAAAQVEFRPRMEGNTLTAILAPKKAAPASRTGPKHAETQNA